MLVYKKLEQKRVIKMSNEPEEGGPGSLGQWLIVFGIAVVVVGAIFGVFSLIIRDSFYTGNYDHEWTPQYNEHDQGVNDVFHKIMMAIIKLGAGFAVLGIVFLIIEEVALAKIKQEIEEGRLKWKQNKK